MTYYYKLVNLLIFFVFSLSEINNYDTHIITTFALRSINIWGKQSIHETFANFSNLYFSLHLYVNIINDLLTCFGLPDTIATYDDEICLIRNLVHLDVWHRGNSLILELDLWILFVSYVTDSS